MSVEPISDELRQIHAEFDRMFAKWSPADTNQTRSLISRITTASRKQSGWTR